jgi:hypothetical protein
MTSYFATPCGTTVEMHQHSDPRDNRVLITRYVARCECGWQGLPCEDQTTALNDAISHLPSAYESPHGGHHQGEVMTSTVYIVQVDGRTDDLYVFAFEQDADNFAQVVAARSHVMTSFGEYPVSDHASAMQLIAEERRTDGA